MSGGDSLDGGLNGGGLPMAALPGGLALSPVAWSVARSSNRCGPSVGSADDPAVTPD
jgi:hypothetical protein